MPTFTRGRAAMAVSKARAENSGNFKPFAPTLSWSKNDETIRYVAFLNDIDDLPRILEHRFIKIGTYDRADGTTADKYGFYLDRKDPSIDEDSDPLTDLGRTSQERYLAAAVELDVTYGEAKGRNKARPIGFEVKTATFNRRIDPEDKESETEEVIYPVVGIIDQAYGNFVTFLQNHADEDGPIQDVAFGVKRLDGKTTTYDFEAFFDQPVDYSNLFAYLDGITYLSDDDEDFADLLGLVEKAGEEAADGLDEIAQAVVIGNALVDKRLEELADKEVYLADVEGLTPEDVKSPYDKGSGDKGKGSKKSGTKRTAARTKRGAKPAEDEPETNAETEEKPAEEKSAGGASKAKFAEVQKRAKEQAAKRKAAKEKAKD